MRKRQKMMVIVLLLLLGLTLAVCSGIYFYAQSHKRAEPTPQGAVQVTQMDPDEVTGLTFVSGEKNLSFSKEGQKWLCENDQSVKVEQPVMEAIVDAVSDLTATEEVMAYDDLSEYGLDNPQGTIALITTKETITLLLGGQNEITGGYYLKREDDTAIRLVDGTVFDSFLGMLMEISAGGE